MEAKKILTIIGIICLMFLGVPIRVKIKQLDEDVIQFNEYINHFNKSYFSNDNEYTFRLENFKASLKRIKELNNNRTSNASALYGLTVYSDMSQEEFINDRLQTNFSKHFYYRSQNRFRKKLFDKWQNNVKSNEENLVIKNSERTKRTIKKLPDKIDWRNKGVISGIRNQKTCGACWAFSTVETVEAMNALKTGFLQVLSVQEMIDCAKKGNYGCEGGDSCSLLDWLISSQTKITLEKNYHFAYETQTCKIKAPVDGVQVKNFTCDNFVGKEEILLQKLAEHGPVAVAVNAANWQYYLGGIIQFHCSGSPVHLNHAVQIVGYDRTAPVPHYIVRNSWGLEFGDRGYMYIAINGNICGIANEVSSLDVV